MNQGFGVFIAVIMVGSIFGFALLFSGNQQDQETDEFDSNLPSSTVLQMTADNVEANVVEVLPKVLFSAYTNEADILAIDNKIALVKGIYKIDSKYKQTENSTFGTSLVYIAEISFEKEKNTEELISEITDSTKDVLFEPDFFEVVLVSVPKKLKFSNEQGFDLNYEYSDSLNLVYVLPGTLKGDKLLIRIYASFTGNTMVSSFASATKNLTGEPQIHSFDLTKPIEEKLPRLVFGSFSDYSDYIKDEVLKEKILSLSGTVDANIVSVKPENYFTVFFDAETDFKEEFTKLLNDNNDSINSIEVFEAGTGFSAEIYFKGEDALETENLVKGFLEEKNALNISVTESVSQIFASISLASPDSAKTVSELNELLDELNFKQTQIQQEVVVLFDSFVSEEGKEFIPDENTVIEVFVSPEMQKGDEVELKTEVETIRGIIASIHGASE